MKKVITALVAGMVLIGSFSAAGAADLPDEYWTPSAFPQGEGWRSLYIGDNTTLNREPSEMYAEMDKTENSSGQPISYHCKNVDDVKCVELTNISAFAFLQPCDTKIITNCIESLYAISPSGEKIYAINPTPYPTASKWDFEGNDSINLPVGKTPSVWTIPGITHGGGNTEYMVQAYTSSFLKKAANTKVTTEAFNLQRIVVSISPVTKISGRYSQQVAQDSTETPEHTGRGVMHPSIDEWRYCAMIDDGSCQKRQPFPADTQFGVKIRFQKKITGWLHGRIFNPSVNIQSSSDGSQTVEVTALPVSVPIIGEWFRWTELSPAIQQYVLDGKMEGGQGFFATKNQANGSFQEMIGTSGDKAFAALSLWLPQIKDRASANPSTWTFYNLTSYELQNADRCISSATDLVGFVTTNATVYAAGFPTYNQSEGTLDYKVMAPHFTSKGDVFKGSYDLRIKADIARCIYGFSNAPVRAAISILSEDGTTQTATETIQEKDGWLSLSAKGFTYSSPTIRVKLSQEEPKVEVTPAPSPTPTVVKKVVLKKITCQKGRVKKVLTGSAPKCPTGYKKVG